MLLSKLVGERTKECPSDATITSHKLLVRAGYIKSVSNGIWSLAMPAKRICQKIEAIIRDEMNKIDGQEVSFPVVMPKELWEESGRYTSIGDEMVRFSDRSDRGMVLGMTHEEAAVHFCRDAVNSYQQLPCMVYQFQTKFRDEARARGGLIRVREFIMKDAYSFHESQQDLEEYYQKAYNAYNNIFKRIGMKRVFAVKSDTGMMGGSVAHEYMLLTQAGEDTIVNCPTCGYMANMEVAVSNRPTIEKAESRPLEEVYTADKGEILEICDFLNIPVEKTIKAVCYNVKGSEEVVVVFIRGDLEVNEAKLKKIVKKDIVPANLKDSTELFAGNIGPVGLVVKNGTIVYDLSLKDTADMVAGANKHEYHLKGVELERDLKNPSFYDIAKVREGELCPVCGKPLALENGIEVGNIFQLGTKYTKAMNMTVLDKEGKAFNPIMGCYGIGVGRALASVAEESNDKYGLIWPMAIAPWQVHICALRMDDENVRKTAFELYENLKKAGVETLLDDRDASAGYKFSDCDLMGVPIRLVVSPKTLDRGVIEAQTRDKTIKKDILLCDVISEISDLIKSLS